MNRDELADGGAGIYAATIREVRARLPHCSVEVLIPDFKGDEDALAHGDGRPARHPGAQPGDG